MMVQTHPRSQARRARSEAFRKRMWTLLRKSHQLGEMFDAEVFLATRRRGRCFIFTSREDLQQTFAADELVSPHILRPPLHVLMFPRRDSTPLQSSNGLLTFNRSWTPS